MRLGCKTRPRLNIQLSLFLSLITTVGRRVISVWCFGFEFLVENRQFRCSSDRCTCGRSRCCCTRLKPWWSKLPHPREATHAAAASSPGASAGASAAAQRSLENGRGRRGEAPLAHAGMRERVDEGVPGGGDDGRARRGGGLPAGGRARGHSLPEEKRCHRDEDQQGVRGAQEEEFLHRVLPEVAGQKAEGV
jgi:hypothetical protein